MGIYYSATTKGFYDSSLISAYEKMGNWPVDAIEMTDKEISTYYNNPPPQGKILSNNDYGRPAWADMPPPSPEQLVSNAAKQKIAFRAAADSEIAWRQDAVDADIATAEEIALLAEWKKYRVLLMRVDTSKAPGIDWPNTPEA